MSLLHKYLSQRVSSGVVEKFLIAGAVGTLAAYAISLARLFAAHGWLVDIFGHPIVTDFLSFWTTGNLAHQGKAALAYNMSSEHAAQVVVVGHKFDLVEDWPYPPAFLLVASALACLSYSWSYLTWVCSTFSGYAAVIASVTRSRTAVLLALAAPWTLAEFISGQNGFLTATLAGFALLTLDTKPIVSGILLGLLTYKPQFGVLFPLALIVGGHWRVIAWATGTTIVVTVLSAALFGAETISAFLSALPTTTQALVVQGHVGWGRLQSAYGFIRWAGFSNYAGWLTQGIAAVLCAVAIIHLWRSSVTQSLKSAGLIVAALSATPYVLVYDFPVLAVAIAFLYREKTFDMFECMAIVLAVLCVVIYAATQAPVGLLSVLAVATIVLRRFSTTSRDLDTGCATRNEAVT